MHCAMGPAKCSAAFSGMSAYGARCHGSAVPLDPQVPVVPKLAEGQKRKLTIMQEPTRSPLIPQGEIHPEQIVIIHALIHDIMPQPRAEDDRIDPPGVQRADAEGEVDPV